MNCVSSPKQMFLIFPWRKFKNALFVVYNFSAAIFKAFLENSQRVFLLMLGILILFALFCPLYWKCKYSAIKTGRDKPWYYTFANKIPCFLFKRKRFYPTFSWENKQLKMKYHKQILKKQNSSQWTEKIEKMVQTWHNRFIIATPLDFIIYTTCF